MKLFLLLERTSQSDYQEHMEFKESDNLAIRKKIKNFETASIRVHGNSIDTFYKYKS